MTKRKNSSVRHDRRWIPWLVFVALGICPLLAGLLFFWGAGQRSEVVCTRIETSHVDCNVERAFLGLVPGESFTVRRVRGTELNTSCDSDGCTYGLDLVGAEEVVSLTSMSTSELDSVEAEKARLDDFLNNTAARSIEYEIEPTWLGMVVSLPFILLGGFITVRGLRSFLAK